MTWFASWPEFFAMGGYAFHVWISWGLSVGSMIIIVIMAKRRNAKIKRELKRQYQREAKLSENTPVE